jgi:lipopolysaccharide export system ATP-binding protein
MPNRNPKADLSSQDWFENVSIDGIIQLTEGRITIQMIAGGHEMMTEGAAHHTGETDSDVLLYTRGLKKVYDGRAVVNGVDIEVKRGEIVGLLGPNGAGKTTTFYMIVGLVRPNGGKVVFDGNDATTQPMYIRARLGMGYLPQEESIFRKLSVRDNILAVMETQPFTKDERRDQCQALMEKFGIDHVADNLALTLSGGEKRRLTIARSLVTEPKLLMLDEPFSGVDPIAVSEIQDIIRMLRSAGLAILITDHNVRETLNIVDRAYMIYEGQVRRHGTKEFLVNDPIARKLYLGEDFSM